MRLLRELQRGVKSAGPQGYPAFGASGCDMSAASTTGSTIDCEHMATLGVEYQWSGSSVTGSIQLQVSISGANWINQGSAVSVAADTGKGLLAVADVGFNYARLVYTKSGGTGTLNAYAQAKGF